MIREPQKGETVAIDARGMHLKFDATAVEVQGTYEGPDLRGTAKHIVTVLVPITLLVSRERIEVMEEA